MLVTRIIIALANKIHKQPVFMNSRLPLCLAFCLPLHAQDFLEPLDAAVEELEEMTVVAEAAIAEPPLLDFAGQSTSTVSAETL